MNTFGGSLDEKLRDAAELLKAGQKKEARQLLREALSMDRNNLATWELLWRAAYNIEEELRCLKRILAINPNHKEARQRFASLRPADVGAAERDSQPLTTSSQVSSRETFKRSSSRRKKQQSSILLLFLGSLVTIVCASVTGFALYRGGYVPLGAPSARTATALAEKNASCQVLIDKAIQASGSFCDNTSSNNVCYGNTIIKAELAPETNQRFSERGDIIAVDKLRRLSASPLNLDNDEWGIAVFKVIANLPRSLPGETVTMVVFGNATLDNAGSDSGNLESFYFSSELGQIVCEKVPFDGLMITSPNGSGVRFTINDAELTLMGSASIKAIKNGTMEISVYKGSARIVSNGEERYFGAGQKVNIELGGENGNQSISGPSEPESLTDEDMKMACTLTGQYCTQSEIIPVSGEQALTQIQSEITSTPTIIPTRTLSPIPSSTIMATNTLLVLPTATYSPGPPTRTKTPKPTNTPGPTLTFTRTNTPTLTFTPSFTPSFTPITPTNTPPSPTLTPLPPVDSLCGSAVSLGPLTNPSPNNIAVAITNNSAGDIAINRFFAYWVKTPQSQKLDRLELDADLLWNTSDSDTPSDIPAEGSWRSGVNFTINSTATRTLLVQFQNDLQSTGYEVHIFFDIGGTTCKVVGIK
jgi:hypothetical protein